MYTRLSFTPAKQLAFLVLTKAERLDIMKTKFDCRRVVNTLLWREQATKRPPRCVSVSGTLAGWLFSHSHIIILYGILLPNSDHIVEPGGLVAGHEVGDGVFVQILLDHLLQALPEGEGPAAGHAVAALVAGAETGHGD